MLIAILFLLEKTTVMSSIDPILGSIYIYIYIYYFYVTREGMFSAARVFGVLISWFFKNESWMVLATV